MGRLGCISTILLAACGRLGFDDSAVVAPDAAVSEAAPQVCAEPSWPSVVIADPMIDVSVVPTPTGVALVWVAMAGGNIAGIELDASGNITSDMSSGVIKTGTYYTTSIGYMNGTLVEAESDGGSVKLDTMQADITSASEIACPTATVASKTPFVQAGADLVAPTAWGSGLTVNPFDSGWNALPIQLYETSDPATGITAVTFGSIAEVVWSTDTACYVEQLSSMSAGVHTASSVPCASPRVAASATTIALVFEAADGVHVSTGGPAEISADTAPLMAPGGKSPRIAFDGGRFWISYVDGSQLVVGYLAMDGTLRSTTVAAAPAASAYELVMASGSPWLYAVDAAGLGGHQLCVP